MHLVELKITVEKRLKLGDYSFSILSFKFGFDPGNVVFVDIS
jgi:hypothetical protein|tara:strand:+ start:18637 stop:18762 length:126 start_codon:yes stop_codon:yes gene_type:complete